MTGQGFARLATDDHRGDHNQHHPGGSRARPEEPRPAPFLVRVEPPQHLRREVAA
jgi:hypothetical protein